MSKAPHNTGRYFMRTAHLSWVGMVYVALVAPMLTGAWGESCVAIASNTEAPDAEGTWAINYDDTMGVVINIGGAVYAEEIDIQGGAITIDHEGQPITFDLDCSRPEVLCPSEAWPSSVRVEQRTEGLQHQMHVMLPIQECNGELVEADPNLCGWGTANPWCDEVCDGEMVPTEAETFGVINEEGSAFDLLLGATAATNGVNCALLGVSLAAADLDLIGSAETNDWEAVGMMNGEVTTGYAGGCLWAGDPDEDDELEAMVLAATITFTTGFDGTKL